MYNLFLTLLTWVTTASTTSPLNGRNTMALYFTGYSTKPLPGWITPAPMLSIVVTAITKPYLKENAYICESALHEWSIRSTTLKWSSLKKGFDKFLTFYYVPSCQVVQGYIKVVVVVTWFSEGKYKPFEVCIIYKYHTITLIKKNL